MPVRTPHWPCWKLRADGRGCTFRGPTYWDQQIGWRTVVVALVLAMAVGFALRGITWIPIPGHCSIEIKNKIKITIKIIKK